MSDTGKQSPLGINALGALLQNQGFWINPKVSGLVGSSKTNEQYNPGDIINNTSLYWLTYAINQAWNKAIWNLTTDVPDPIDALVAGLRYRITSIGDSDFTEVGAATNTVGTVFLATGPGPLPTPPKLPGYAALCDVDNETYENLINIGQSRIPALGNSPPPTYLVEDPSNQWSGEATTGYPINSNQGQGQSATWFPFDTTNPNLGASQWGWLRLIALQAWNEYNYNGESVTQDPPNYQYFTQSFLGAQGYVDNSNKAIYAIQDSKKFLQGVYSNMDDLTSSDITGVSLASRAFGQDLLNLGKALDLSTIATFGLPSNLLKTLKKNNAITENINYALIAAGITPSDLPAIFSGEPVPLTQEQAIYGAFSVITDDNLKQILTTLNCKTKGLTSLVDLLNVRKLFPISYPSLTVPIYNTVPSPTNSKTYYLLFINGQLNPQLIAPAVAEQIVPIPAPPVEPPPPPPPPAPPIVTVEQVINTLPPINPYVDEAAADVAKGNLPPAQITFGGGGGCVALESFIPLVETEKTHNGKPVTYAWQLESGMTISIGDTDLQITNGKVVKTMNDYQPCVRVTTADGISLVCSTTAPLLTKELGFINAPDVFGKRIAVMRNGVTYFDEVVHIEDVGEKFVRVIDTGNNSFWAGATADGYILHHNAMINDNLTTQKF